MNILQIDMNEPMCQRVSVVRYNSACRLIFGEDNSYMSGLRDTHTQPKFLKWDLQEELHFSLMPLAKLNWFKLHNTVTIICLNGCTCRVWSDIFMGSEWGWRQDWFHGSDFIWSLQTLLYGTFVNMAVDMKFRFDSLSHSMEQFYAASPVPHHGLVTDS